MRAWPPCPLATRIQSIESGQISPPLGEAVLGDKTHSLLCRSLLCFHSTCSSLSHSVPLSRPGLTCLYVLSVQPRTWPRCRRDGRGHLFWVRGTDSPKKSEPTSSDPVERSREQTIYEESATKQKKTGFEVRMKQVQILAQLLAV